MIAKVSNDHYIAGFTSYQVSVATANAGKLLQKANTFDDNIRVLPPSLENEPEHCFVKP